MTDKKNSSNKKYEYKFIQFAISKEEKKHIKEIANESGAKTISNFIRDAINEKIIRIKQNISPLSQQTDSHLLQEIRNLFQTQSQEQNKLLNTITEKIEENDRFYEELMNNFIQLQSYISREDYEETTQKIYHFIKTLIDVSNNNFLIGANA